MREAMDEVTRLTGLQFIVDGPTEERPSPDRGLYESGSSVYAPVLVAWATVSDDPGLNWKVEAYASPVWIHSRHVSGTRRYASGEIVLDSDAIGTLLLMHHGARAAARAVILHELGHLVGLDHVPDTHELMNPQLHLSTTDFGPGDRHGLAELGTGRCFMS